MAAHHNTSHRAPHLRLVPTGGRPLRMKRGPARQVLLDPGRLAGQATDFRAQADRLATITRANLDQAFGSRRIIGVAIARETVLEGVSAGSLLRQAADVLEAVSRVLAKQGEAAP